MDAKTQLQRGRGWMISYWSNVNKETTTLLSFSGTGCERRNELWRKPVYVSQRELELTTRPKTFSVTTHTPWSKCHQSMSQKCGSRKQREKERETEMDGSFYQHHIRTADRLNIGAAVALICMNVGSSCMCSAPHEEKSFVWSEQLLSRLLLMGFHHSGTNRMARSQNRTIRHPHQLSTHYYNYCHSKYAVITVIMASQSRGS